MISSSSLDSRNKNKTISPNRSVQSAHSIMSEPQLVSKKSNHQQQLQQILTCHICYCPASIIMMCPFCSKIYCQPCIKKSLFIKPECPHCRKHIKDLKSMANCSRFVNQIKQIVQQVLQQRQKQNFRCEEHDVALNYYCIQCEKSVCCECKMFGSHKEHNLIQIQKKFQEKHSAVRSLLAQLRIHLKQKQQLKQKLQNKLKMNEISQINQNKQISNIQQQYREKSSEISFKQNEQNGVLFKLQSLIQEINKNRKQIKNQGYKLKKQKKFNLNYQLKQGLQRVIMDFPQRLSTIKLQSLKKQNQLLRGLIPPYSYQIFMIQNFPNQQKQQKVIYGNEVSILNRSWRLKIYPNGNQVQQKGYISIFLEMVDKVTNDTGFKASLQKKNILNTYEYEIQILRPNHLQQNRQQKRLCRQYISSFESGQCWGYNKYAKLEQLYKQKFIDQKEDKLTIKYGIRRPDYFSLFKSQQQEMEQIEKQILKEQHLLEELQSKASQNQPQKLMLNQQI